MNIVTVLITVQTDLEPERVVSILDQAIIDAGSMEVVDVTSGSSGKVLIREDVRPGEFSLWPRA